MEAEHHRCRLEAEASGPCPTEPGSSHAAGGGGGPTALCPPSRGVTMSAGRADKGALGASMPDNFAGKADITRSVTIVGLVIVAISMVRLVNRITMGILERIRDIGMLRCVGARARHIRGIFATKDS